MFIKAQIASFLASVTDFLAMLLMVELLGLWYGTASVLGNVIGAIVHFSIGRLWVFRAKNKNILPQMLKYLFMWFGYILITFILLVTVKELLHMHYQIAKILVAVFMSVTYSYWLQKKIIFN